jgi:ubiquinone/menaquinone biosynthesis C-methylase UbiE
MRDWDAIFRKAGAIHRLPENELVELIPFFKKHQVRKILDVGCGMGRHLLLLKNSGFDVYGCDISEKAIISCTKIIGKRKVKKCDMSKLGFEDKTFDLVISTSVIQHAIMSKVKKTIKEFLRVLKDKGLIFIITLSTEDFSYKTGKEIAPYTKINTNQLDGKVPHYYFTKQKLLDVFSDFEIIMAKPTERESCLSPGKKRGAWVMLARKK